MKAPTFAVLAALLASPATAAPFLTPAAADKLWETWHEGQPGTDVLPLRLPVSATLSIDATFSISSKGNGVLTVPGASIRVYDVHDDGAVFAPALLNNDLVDVDNDGYKDLIFWGTVRLFAVDPATDANLVAERPAFAVFWFNPSTRKFINTVANRDVDVH